MKSMKLELGFGEYFEVDMYMNVYYCPYEDCDWVWQTHASKLNQKDYREIYLKYVSFINEQQLDSKLNFDEFKTMMERIFQMYCLLR